MKRKVGDVVLIIIGAGLLIYLLFSSIIDLTNRSDIHTVTIDSAFEVLQLEHSINGLIPIGTDYYYIGIEEDTYNAYLIKGSEKWLSNNFDSDYKALNTDGVQVTGLAKEIHDYRTEKEIETRLSELEGINYPLGMSYCLDLGYKFFALFKFIDAVLFIAVIIAGVYIYKFKNNVKPLYSKLLLAVIMTALIMLIVIIGKI